MFLWMTDIIDIIYQVWKQSLLIDHVSSTETLREIPTSGLPIATFPSTFNAGVPFSKAHATHSTREDGTRPVAARAPGSSLVLPHKGRDAPEKDEGSEGCRLGEQQAGLKWDVKRLGPGVTQQAVCRGSFLSRHESDVFEFGWPRARFV